MGLFMFMQFLVGLFSTVNFFGSGVKDLFFFFRLQLGFYVPRNSPTASVHISPPYGWEGNSLI